MCSGWSVTCDSPCATSARLCSLPGVVRRSGANLRESEERASHERACDADCFRSALQADPPAPWLRLLSCACSCGPRCRCRIRSRTQLFAGDEPASVGMDCSRHSWTDRPIAAQDCAHGHWLDDRKRNSSRFRAALGLHVTLEVLKWCVHGGNASACFAHMQRSVARRSPRSAYLRQSAFWLLQSA